MSLVGTWDMESSENFDEYMKEIGKYFNKWTNLLNCLFKT